MAVTSQSWMLDAIAFHHDFGDRLRGPEGLVAVRDRAVQIWDGADPVVHDYLASLVVSTPEDWYRACEDTYLVDWYRVLMAPWLSPTRSIQSPDALRRGLPQLGWHATESRRLARGRELLTLAERHLGGETFEQLLNRFGWGHKGWLDIDDVTGHGPENINVLRPSAPYYRVGVHYFASDGAGPQAATLTIYCNGPTPVARLGPVTVTSRAGPEASDLWIAADIIPLAGGGCRVAPISRAGQPWIAPISEAMRSPAPPAP